MCENIVDKLYSSVYLQKVNQNRSTRCCIWCASIQRVSPSRQNKQRSPSCFARPKGLASKRMRGSTIQCLGSPVRAVQSTGMFLPPSLLLPPRRFNWNGVLHVITYYIIYVHCIYYIDHRRGSWICLFRLETYVRKVEPYVGCGAGVYFIYWGRSGLPAKKDN